MQKSFWYQQPLRILQTVLREIDAQDYDPQSVVEYMKKTHCNTLVINGGGIFDMFPNPLPCASPVSFCEGTDIVREISTACKQAGFRVIVRVDFRGVVKDIYDQHPAWFGRQENGEPIIRGYTSLPLYAPCYNSYYRNEHAIEFLSYLFEHYDIDGIWHNAVLSHGDCFCERCRESYTQSTGKELHSQNIETFKHEYLAWKTEQARQHLQKMRQTVKGYGEDKAYVAEVFSMFDVKRPLDTGVDLYDAKDFFDFLVSVAFLTENTPAPEYFNLSYAATIVKFLKALDQRKQPVLLFGGNGTSHRYVKDPSNDLKIWLYEALSMGGGFWNCYFNGQHPEKTHDRRNAEIAIPAYKFLEDNAALFSNTKPCADVTIYYSKPSKDFSGSDDIGKDEYCTAVQGMERILLEHQIQYNFITDLSLTEEVLQQITCLLLPNACILSDTQINLIKNWVREGGKLLATYKTSLYDEQAVARDNFGLADLFGCRFSGEIFGTSYDTYQSIEDIHNPLLEDIEDTELLITNGLTLACDMTPASQSSVICRHIPKIVNQPPEKAWRKPMVSEHPTILHTRYGKGQCIYFANQIDKYVYVNGHDDFRLLLKNAIRYLTGERILLHTNAPESVHVHMLQNPEQGVYIVSLVNCTSTPYRPLRKIIPVSDITLELSLEKDIQWNVSVLYGEENYVQKQEGDVVQIYLDTLQEFQAFLVSPM